MVGTRKVATRSGWKRTGDLGLAPVCPSASLQAPHTCEAGGEVDARVYDSGRELLEAPDVMAALERRGREVDCATPVRSRELGDDRLCVTFCEQLLGSVPRTRGLRRAWAR